MRGGGDGLLIALFLCLGGYVLMSRFGLFVGRIGVWQPRLGTVLIGVGRPLRN